MNTDAVKDRLRKLFAIADNDAASQGEIDNALAIASSIMRANAITREDVTEDERGVNTSKVEYGKRTVKTLYKSLTKWESYLANFITEFVPGCGHYRSKVAKHTPFGRCTGSESVIVFYGPEQDVQLCEEIWHEVILFVQSAARLRYGTALARGEAAAYAEGFGRGLWEANKKDLEKLEDQSRSDCNALIVVNRSLAIKDGGKDWLKEKHGVRLSKGNRITSQQDKNRYAYNQGRSDGAGYKPGAKKKAGYLT